MTVPLEKAPANFVPAAAVIRRVQALFGMTGRKERVGGTISCSLNPTAYLLIRGQYCGARVRERGVEF